MNKSKYLALGLAGVIAFSPMAVSAANDPVNAVNEKEMISEKEEMENVYMEYKGKIIEIQEDKEKNNISILVEGQTKDTQERLVFHLRQDMPLISHKTMENVPRENLESGMEVSAFYKENTPMTLSIPAQTSPDALVIHDSEEDGFVKVAHFNEELVDVKNELKLNISDETVLVDAKGNKVEDEDIKDEDLMVFYTVSTKSIPAQTSPEKVILLDEEEEMISVMDKLMIDGKEFKLDHEIYEEDGHFMIALRPIGEALGYEVKWNNEERSAELTKDAQWTKVTIGQDNYNFAKMLVKLGKAPLIKDNKTYVPVDFIEEVLKMDTEVNEGILEIK